LVLATDTWLHFTTKTVTFTQIERNSGPSNLGFGVYPNCTDVQITSSIDCNLNNPASGYILMDNEPVRVLSNISSTMLVKTLNPETVPGNGQYAYIANAELAEMTSIDYTANTYAVRSQCTPITSQCINENDIVGVGTRYKCPFAFEGEALTSVNAANSVTMAYFTDSSGSNNNTITNAISNPYYFAAAAVVNVRNLISGGLATDPEIVKGGHGGSTIIVLFCNATVYDFQYTSVAGATRFTASPSNYSMTNIVQGSQALTHVGDANLVQAASVAGLGDSAQAIADQFALSYSQTALAVASGAFEPRPALASQTRRNILVARVPIAPLACLVAANLLLAVLGIVLAVVALVSCCGNTREVQARLSIAAVVATLFEGPRVRAPVVQVEDMFEEKHGEPGPRVGFSRTSEGGWVFDIRHLPTQAEEVVKN
jgi:hypothetical protein